MTSPGRFPQTSYQQPAYPPAFGPPVMPSGGYYPYGPPPSSYIYSLPPAPETPPAAPSPPPAPAKPEPVKAKPSPEEPVRPEFFDEIEVDEKPVERPAKKPAPQPVRAPEKRRPASFAEEAGEQVGAWVTRFIEQNPHLEQGLRQLDPETLFQNPNSPLNHFRDQFQNSWAARNLLKHAEGPLLKTVPRDLQPVVKQGLAWLRSKPEEL